MFKYHCLNPIADVGLEKFTKDYEKTGDVNEADGILVRSAAMHDMELPEKLLAVARAGAGVNNIPLDKCAEKGIVVFNTPGANANGVKELVIAYEPIWAIGTGKTATTEQAQEVCKGVRDCIAEMYDEATAEAVRIQYGGSVNAGNAAELFAQPDIDGGLVGGASLKADFGKIVNYK